MSQEREWLFRTHQHRIEGPFTRDELLDRAEAEAFGPMDEICKANSHWIALRDRTEAEEALGEPLPFPAHFEEAEEETTATDLIRVVEGGFSHSSSPGVARQRPEAFASRMGAVSVSTSGYVPRRMGQGPTYAASKPVETAALWKFLLAILVIFAAFLFGALLRLIQPSQTVLPKEIKPAVVAAPSNAGGIEVGSPPPRLDQK